MDASLAFANVFSMWKIALPAMFLGCYLGVVLRTGKLLAFFSRLTRTITALGGLPEALGSFFILCLINRYAANAMLAEFERSGVISQRTLIAVYLMGSLPTGIYFTIFYFSPLLITGLGWKLGIIFIVVNISMSTLVTIIGLLWNRLLIPPLNITSKVDMEACSTQVEKTNFWAAGIKAWKQFWDIAKFFLPITLVSSLLIHMGFVQELVSKLNNIFQFFDLTTSGVMVIIAGIPTIMAAIGVAGTLLKSGQLAASDVVFVLLLTSFFHNVYDGLSRVLPTNLSIFGAKTGGIVTVIGTGLYLVMVASAAFLALILGRI